MRIALIISVLGMAATAHADGSSLRPGLYETVSSMEMDGRPMGSMPASTRCITAAEAKDPASATKAPEGCDLLDVKKSGNTVNWSVSCHLRGGTQAGNGELVYTTDTMKMTTTIVMNIPNVGQKKMIYRSDVHRVGDCAK
jgi:hypothetical protein